MKKLSIIELNRIIERFIKQWNSLKQKSDEWYKQMGKTIGGSEIASLFGENEYKSYDEMVTSKAKLLLGIKEEISNAPCSWGTIFEPVIAMIVELDCDTTVYANGEDGISITKYRGHRTSPDGYCVMGFNLFDNGNLVVNSSTSSKEPDFYSIVLLEFKCPFGRFPNGTIPHHYLPQVLSGLAVSPIASFGVYVDGAFKVDSLDDLLSVEAIAYGIIGVYGDKPSKYITDYGTLSTRTFNDEIVSIVQKKRKLIHLTPHMTIHEDDIKQGLRNDVNTLKQHDNLIGFIPWRLIFITYVPVQRCEEFIDKLQPVLDVFHEDVSDRVEKIKNKEPIEPIERVIEPFWKNKKKIEPMNEEPLNIEPVNVADEVNAFFDLIG